MYILNWPQTSDVQKQIKVTLDFVELTNLFYGAFAVMLNVAFFYAGELHLCYVKVTSLGFELNSLLSDIVNVLFVFCFELYYPLLHPCIMLMNFFNKGAEVLHIQIV